MMLEFLVDEIIESASNNTAGTLLDENALNSVIESVINSQNLNPNHIDQLLVLFETESGVMVKTNNIISVLKPYMVGDEIDFCQEEHSEKDLTVIDILYGDFHHERGDI